MARVIAIALLVLGLVGVLFGEIPYTTQTHHVTMGPMTMDVQERKAIPLPRWVGVVLVVAGVGLLVAGRKGREP